MRPADRAWLSMAASIVVYDLLAHEDEQLSNGVDRYLEPHPWLTRAVVVLTAGHLLNLLPVWLDPFTWPRWGRPFPWQQTAPKVSPGGCAL